MLAGLLDLVAPLSCTQCRRAASPLLCARCAATPPLGWVRPPTEIRSVWAFARYHGAVRQSIVEMKFQRRSGLARAWGRVLARYSPSFYVDCVVPVPLTLRRLFTRGFNPAALIARPVAATLDVPLLTDALRRVRSAAPSSRAHRRGRSSRARHTEHAFEPSRGAIDVRDARVLLVDDVLTTGATARDCARALLSAGAADVDLLVVARTPRSRTEERGRQRRPRSGTTRVPLLEPTNQP